MKKERITYLKEADFKKGPVLYWMSREYRYQDNWSLVFAVEKALLHKTPLLVCICLGDDYFLSTLRRCAFLLDGLAKLKEELQKKNINLIVSAKKAEHEIPYLVDKMQVSEIICDFDPLKKAKASFKKVTRLVNTTVTQIDSHNIVPCPLVSQKQEYAAYTIRPKIHKLLPFFLEEFPVVGKHPFTLNDFDYNFDPEKIIAALNPEKSVGRTSFFKPGANEAEKTFTEFCENKLTTFEKNRNNPNKDGQSNLSPYLNFGYISAQKIALSLEKMPVAGEKKAAFLEELVIRKELSDNFCFYNQDYDNIKCAPSWAKTTLAEHKTDVRPYIYTQKEFEYAKTHDSLWNAAQKEMVVKGKMHGYLRMYWAKKILEWTKNPAFAFKTAVYLNDKYSIDGCNPNGYTGIAWSICGVHDRAWFSRDVFGKIRFMSYNGCKNKFDIAAYIQHVKNL